MLPVRGGKRITWDIINSRHNCLQVASAVIPKVIPIEFYKTGSLFVTTSIASGGVQIEWRSKAFPRGLHFSKVGNIVLVYFCFHLISQLVFERKYSIWCSRDANVVIKGFSVRSSIFKTPRQLETVWDFTVGCNQTQYPSIINIQSVVLRSQYRVV